MSRARLIAFPLILRPVADATMSAAALLVAMSGALLVSIESGNAGPVGVNEFLRSLSIEGPILVVLSVSVYVMFGVYGRVRSLPSREKTVQLVGAATLAYATFGLVQPVLPSYTQLGLPVLLWTWALAVVFIVGSRYWSTTWRALTLAEVGLARVARKEPRQKRVLVIGGAGYIGSALVPKLLDRGYRVRVLDLLLFGEAPIKAFAEHPDFELFRADFRQIDRLVGAMEGVDTVVHLGGLVGDPACSIDERLTTEVNLDFTRLIAEVAKGAQVSRFIFASSCSVYGASDEVLNEDSQLNPVSLYARSKIASENILFEMASQEFAPVMLRFGTIYGLSGRSRFDLVVNLLSAKAVVDGEITVFGGDQWRPFVHVDDAARAVQTVLEAPPEKVRNEIFNVGSDEQNATLGDVGHMIQQLVPTARYIDSGRDGDRRNYRVDFAKIHGRLGFTPAWTLEQGIQQVIDAIRKGTISDYKDPMYSNVRFLVEGMAPRYSRVRKDWADRRMDGDVTRSSKGNADARVALLKAARSESAVADGRSEAAAEAVERLTKAGI